MSVIGKYLSRQQIAFEDLEAPNERLKMEVVIPCFMEPDITTTLLSLWQNEFVECGVEVIVVVNSSELATPEQIEFNRQTYNNLLRFAKERNKPDLKLIPLIIEGAKRKHAGVGLARKTGLDLALSRFMKIEQENGVLISLDADSVVSSNYLQSIFNFFQRNPKAVGANLAFEHVNGGDESQPEVYQATLIYELYLRYFKQALKYTGFPYAYHTIGSCFTISANAYARVGGMPRKQAGEDFYLLHKLFPMGYFGEINDAKVYPAARESDRVPFGTGPMVTRILKNNNLLDCYPLKLFLHLKAFISKWDKLYQNKQLLLSALGLEIRLIQFLKSQKFEEDLVRVKNNSASKEAFIKQLFAAFNAFKIIQYLNGTSEVESEKSDIILESSKLLKALGYEPENNDLYTLLSLYRNLDQGLNISNY